MKTFRIFYLLAVVMSQLVLFESMHYRHKMMQHQIDFYIRLDEQKKKADKILADQQACFDDVDKRMPNWVKGDWDKHDAADAECSEVSNRALKSAWAGFDAETKQRAAE